jgi:creatinine amidohydrolase
MELRFSTWQEVGRYLQDSKAIVIPIGSTEQHGPNGLIGTDALCPEALALELGKQADALIAPTISVGMAQHHLAFAGSITLLPSTLILVIRDTVNSLIQHGFERFYFLNGHGGNIATVHAAFSEIYAQASMGMQPDKYSNVRCKLKNWWEAEGVMAQSKELFGEADGSHATCGEVSHRLRRPDRSTTLRIIGADSRMDALARIHPSPTRRPARPYSRQLFGGSSRTT